ncbi:hypothetical protein [Tibeticola sp.]|jgi:hypothetical protein|uniref:hypothetical protein n=1 Tax=Tibeticola sp. TaxID=2005368 RepID=UPI0025ECDF1F|nr:hypothetical protein [Tibeticola sp.]
MASLWNDAGAWIAIGISVLFLVVAWVMHRVIVKVLKSPAPAHDSAAPPRDPS